MDRELLIEIGVEELPAGWLPDLTAQIGRRVGASLHELRLPPAAPVEAYSTPRRLTARVGKIAERQADAEDVVTGPPVSAAYGADGQPTPAALGFARKHQQPVEALVRLATAKGEYIAVRRHVRGKAAVDVLPDVLSALLRSFTFPKTLRWDATLDDGRGDLLFGRPIRWLLFLYGGRVVPFTIFRSALGQGPLVQEVRSGAFTFGHRFLTTSGRAGRAIKVKGFDDYRKRLAENFVVLDRSERQSRITRELDNEARRRGGRVASALTGRTLLQEVPDLIEYPAVVSGSFAEEFLSLPEEILTTTMIHHQHFFPVVGEQQRILPVFLAVLNMQPEKPEVVVRNLERVLNARLRDARFFLDADRGRPFDQSFDRLASVLFHKKLGTYRNKAERLAALAPWVAADVFHRSEAAGHAEAAGRLCKVDLATETVRELTELQGTVGGIYAREAGHPEEVWRAISLHYLPTGIAPGSPPSKEQLGRAAVTWAAVSLADKLDTLCGLCAAGDLPSGSRDPFGVRRVAQGLVRVLVDLPELTGIDEWPTLGPMVRRALDPFTALLPGLDTVAVEHALWPFLRDRLQYVLEQRGFDVRNIRAVTHGEVAALSPLVVRRKLEALPEFAETADFRQLATLFKRVRNIAKSSPVAVNPTDEAARAQLSEPAETALADEMAARGPVIAAALERSQFRHAFAEAAKFGPAVARFFDDVLVMTDDPGLRSARLGLLKRLETLVLSIADISEIVAEDR